jgi:hypothetical protein
MNQTGKDKDGNSVTITNDKIILDGPYWDTIGVNPGIYQYQSIEETKYTVNVRKQDGSPLEFVKTSPTNGQLLVNGTILKIFDIV